MRVVGVCLALLLASVLAFLGGPFAQAGPGPSPIRLGVTTSVNVNLAFVDSATGELRGAGADLARAFATQMGASLEPVVYPSVVTALAAVDEDAWDISMQPMEGALAANALYAGSYLLVELTYLVAEDSPFMSVADLDQPGVRILVNRTSPNDTQLTRLLQHAELVRSDVPGVGAGAALFAGEVDAYANNRENALVLAEQRPGFRVIEDNFAVTEFGMALPRGKELLARDVRQFLEAAKASGLVAQAIEANGARGVQVAGPGQ